MGREDSLYGWRSIKLNTMNLLLCHAKGKSFYGFIEYIVF